MKIDPSKALSMLTTVRKQFYEQKRTGEGLNPRAGCIVIVYDPATILKTNKGRYPLHIIVLLGVLGLTTKFWLRALLNYIHGEAISRIYEVRSEQA